MHSNSVSALDKINERLGVLQERVDRLMADARTDERTDEESISLKMRRDVIRATGARWREATATLERLGQMMEQEGGSSRCASRLSTELLAPTSADVETSSYTSNHSLSPSQAEQKVR